MGQQSSKSHAPLTFGYINHNQQHQQRDDEEGSDSNGLTFEQYLKNNHSNRDRSNTPDFVLDNPHLYKLEFSCQHCSKKTDSQVVVAEQVNTPCRYCRQNKRLSLVRRDLASDLNYIDETYYPNIVHYEEEEGGEENRGESDNMDSSASNTAPGDEDDDTDTLRDEEGWSKLTIGEISPSIPKRLVSSPQLAVDLSGKSLIKLSSSIGYLDNLTKLDLSDNQMINLPKAIGQLKNLRIFNASKNQLESIPDTIIGLKKLKAINLSQNKLTHLPKGLGSLPSLIILILNQNQLTHLPREISNLNDLITLNVSNNPLKSIPAEIATLKSLRKLTAEECTFETEFVHKLAHDSPSLFEICARNMVKSKTSLPSSLAHHHIADYFKTEQVCSFCYGPYFESHVTRGRFIERTGRQIIALDYKLCCAHWTDEEDRISAMFSTPYYKQPFVQHQQVAAEEIVDNISTPTSPAVVEESQQDYFSTVRSSSSIRSRRNVRNTLLPSFSSEDMLLTTLVLPTDFLTEVDDMEESTPISAATSSSSAAAASAIVTTSSRQSNNSTSYHRPSIASSSSASTFSSPSPRPRSSSTSSSLLRIHAMHQQLQQNISAALRQQQEILGNSNGDVLLPFATLNGRQSEEADRILQTSHLITNALSLEEEPEELEVDEQPVAVQQQQQQKRSKKPNGRAIKEGFASLGARLGRRGRDRSETV